MLTMLTIALFILKLALKLLLNSARIALATARKGIQATGAIARKGITAVGNRTGGIGKRGSKGAVAVQKVAQKSLEMTIRVLEMVIKLVDFAITIILSSLLLTAIVVVMIVIALIVAAISPFMFLSTEEGGWGMAENTSQTSSISRTEGGESSGSSDDGNWDFDVVPFEDVKNIPDWLKNNPSYMNGLTEEAKYVVRVLNGKYPDSEIISLVRPGDPQSHGQGKAVDLSAEGEEGWEKTKWLIANADKLKITELIFQSQYWSSSNREAGFQKGILSIHGNKTADHYDHIHISVNYKQG